MNTSRFESHPDRTSTLLALYGEMAEELAGLPVQSERAGHLRRRLATLTEEIERQARTNQA
jgi:hypothetical protein